jgi:hypothetical protein
MGLKFWFDSFNHIERPYLADNQSAYYRGVRVGAPFLYRIAGNQIEVLPTPTETHKLKLWYVPDAPQLTAPGQAIDTIVRFDDFIIWYAAREVATKEENYELIRTLENRLAEIRMDISAVSANRDQNAPQRILNVKSYSRRGYGR